MDYLFVDTNMLVYCSVGQTSGHEPALLKKISEILDHHDAVLLMPETVRREYERRMQSQVERYEKNARDVWQFARKNLLAQPDKDKVRETIDQIIEERRLSADKAREYFRRLMRHEKTVEVPLSGDVVAVALGYAISGQRPSKGWASRDGFDNQEQGFVVENDCLIVSALAEYLRANQSSSEDRLVFCSNNTTDFADHDDVLDDWILDRRIADEFAAFTVYYSELDVAITKEFTSVEITAQDKAEYEDGKVEAAALLTLPELPDIEVTCPNCGCGVRTNEPSQSPIGKPVHCEDCGRDFGIRRDRSGGLVVSSVPRYETRHEVHCGCGHSQTIKTYSDLEAPVERWCLQCYSKLAIDALTGELLKQQADRPHEARIAYSTDSGSAVLVCPECERRVKTFVSIHDGMYAICNHGSHASMLLRAGK